MADWDANEAPRTQVILADSRRPSGASLSVRGGHGHAASRQIVIFSTSPARTGNHTSPPQATSRQHRHLPARSRYSRQNQFQ